MNPPTPLVRGAFSTAPMSEGLTRPRREELPTEKGEFARSERADWLPHHTHALLHSSHRKCGKMRLRPDVVDLKKSPPPGVESGLLRIRFEKTPAAEIIAEKSPERRPGSARGMHPSNIGGQAFFKGRVDDSLGAPPAPSPLRCYPHLILVHQSPACSILSSYG